MIHQKISFIDWLLSECCWAGKSGLKVLAVMEQTFPQLPSMWSSSSGQQPPRTNHYWTPPVNTNRHAGALKLALIFKSHNFPQPTWVQLDHRQCHLWGKLSVWPASTTCSGLEAGILIIVVEDMAAAVLTSNSYVRKISLPVSFT